MAEKRIDWLNHTLEFLVVFIGILIAFQLNKCSDERTQRSLVVNHLYDINEECRQNLDRLDEGIAHSQGQRLLADSLLSLIAAKGPLEQVRNVAVALLDLRSAELNDKAYQVLIASGDIRYIRDFDKKRAIIGLYDALDRVDQTNENVRKLYDNHYYPYLKDHFDLVNWAYVSTEKSDDYYAADFANMVSTYRFLLQAKQQSYEASKVDLEKYLGQR